MSRVLLLTGKGGVGTTTVAAATAVHAARRGHKVLVASTDPAHSLADALGCPVTATPTEVEPGLYALHVDPRTRMQQEWARLGHRLTELAEAVGVDPAAAEDLVALPAAADLLALAEVREHAEAGRWDLVVVDGGATAETLRVLGLPEALTGYLDRALPPGRRVARALAAGATAVAGRGPAPRVDPLLDELRRLADELAALRGLLTAPGTGVRLVLTPERVGLAEARRALTHLSLLGFGVEAVVVNRLVPGDGADPWRSARATREAAVLAAAHETFGDIALLTLGEDASEPVGTDALAGVGDVLYGVGGRDHDPLVAVPTPAALHVDRVGDRWVLRLGLPHAQRSELDLHRRGDDLEVRVGGLRRVLALPSVLRRCAVVGARLRDGELRVEFEPDPALWPDGAP